MELIEAEPREAEPDALRRGRACHEASSPKPPTRRPQQGLLDMLSCEARHTQLRALLAYSYPENGAWYFFS